MNDDRLAQRIAAIRGEEVFNDEGSDRFFIPPHMIPDGWSYEWKVKEVYGKEERHHQLHLGRRGWEPVPADRHPGYEVQQGGMILMERPMEITRESIRRNELAARGQILAKERQLGGGEDLADDVPVVRRQTGVKRTIEHQPIPD